jgi:hypothetical protein
MSFSSCQTVAKTGGEIRGPTAWMSQKCDEIT